LKLKGPRFGHQKISFNLNGNIARREGANDELRKFGERPPGANFGLSPESVNQSPVGSFFRRVFYGYDDEIAAGCAGNHVCGSEVSLLPAITLLHQFSLGILDVH